MTPAGAILIRIGINAVAMWAAIYLLGTIDSIAFEPQNTEWWAFVLLGVIVGSLNLVVRPILNFLTCPLIILTLGLFTLVINGVIFWLTGWVGQLFGIGYTMGPWPDWAIAAFLGGLIVGIVNTVLTLVLLRNE